MPGMRSLTIVVATPDPARFHASLSLAAAQAALGGRARLHLHGTATGLLDDLQTGEIAELYAEAAALGVEFTACQSGLAALGDSPLPAGIDSDGPVGLLSRLGDDRLVVV